MVKSFRNERGIALVVTLFALVIIGALVSGAFFVGRVEYQTSANTRWSAQSQEAAEAGLAHVVANWDPINYNNMPIYTGNPAQEIAMPTVQLGSAALQFTDTIRRLNVSLFLVRSTGVRRVPATGQILSTTRYARLMRLAKPTIGVNAAVTIGQPVKLNGNAFVVDGFNSLPTQWGAGECAPLDAGNSDDVVGVRSAVATGVGSADLNNVFGFPTKTVANDPTVTSATFQDFLDYTYTTLKSQPNVKFYPDVTPYNGVAPILDNTVVPAVCDKSKLLNLGEPWRNPPTAGAVAECTGYFPVVNGTGAQTEFAAGNRGQGTLLVDGDLVLAGGFQWVGLIIVRGQMKVNGTGNKIYGAVLSEGVNLSSGALGGDIEIHYSDCAVQKAVSGASLALPLGQRGWTQLF